MNQQYNIMTFDGGGIRGLVSLTLLKRLQREFPDILDKTDFYAGTSIGGIIALGLAGGKSVDNLIDFYVKNGKTIFSKSIWHSICKVIPVAGARYGNSNLKQILINEFGEHTQLEDLKKKVLVSSFQLDNSDSDINKRTWSPKFFHNFDGEDSDGYETVVDVALRTSAAPSYFPSYGSYIDGGVVANNPSMAALAQTQDKRAVINPRPTLNDINLLSIGTGGVLSYKDKTNVDWGLGQWAFVLLDLLFDASSGIADYEVKMMLRDNYYRLAPLFPTNTPAPALDDCNKIQDIIDFANGVDITSSLEWVKNKWYKQYVVPNKYRDVIV